MRPWQPPCATHPALTAAQVLHDLTHGDRSRPGPDSMTRRTARYRSARGRRRARLAGSASLVGTLLLYLTYRELWAPAGAAPEPGPGAPEVILEQAALRRFATSTPSVTGPDGEQRPVTDPGRARALEVLHFKQLLVNQELARNPGLAEQADANLRAGRPAQVSVAWHTPAGEEWVEKIVADTVSCGLADLDTPVELSFRQLAQRSCLYDDDPAYWDTVGTSVTISLTPIGEDEVAWESLRHKEMRDIVAWAYVLRILQAQQQQCASTGDRR